MSFSLVLRKAELENPLCMSRHMLYLSPTQPPSPLQISSVRTFVSMCSKIDGNHQLRGTDYFILFCFNYVRGHKQAVDVARMGQITC